MRLNRVLLLAATINILIFALVFTVSCSGEDGNKGKQGDNCYVDENNDDGFDVYCGNRQVGTMNNNDEGEPGPDGPKGPKGDDGDRGPNCHVEGLNIYCGDNDELKGSLDGCTANLEPGNNNYSIITCKRGSDSTKIHICRDPATEKTQIFNPLAKACNAAGLLITNTFIGTCPDGKTTYDIRKQYCGYGALPKKANDSTEYTVQNFCGYEFGRKETLNLEGASGKLAGATDYKAACLKNGWHWIGYRGNASQIAASTTPHITDSCYRNVPEKKQQYCRYTLKNEGHINRPIPKLAKWAYVDSITCSGSTAKPNNGSWKGEYCGYANKDALTTTIQKDLCHDFWNVDSLNRLIDTSLLAPVKLTNPTGLRANIAIPANFGPNEVRWQFSYCSITFENKDKVPTRTITDTTFCNYAPTGLRAPLNKSNGSTPFQRQYCGYKNTVAQGAPGAGFDTMMVYKDMCDDGKGPSEFNGKDFGYCQASRPDANGVSTTTYSTAWCLVPKTGGQPGETTPTAINSKTWNFQYCGVDKNGAAKRHTDICDDDKGPSEISLNGGYCKYSKNGKSAYSDAFCGDGGKPNDALDESGKWKGEYCGYETDSSSLSSVLSGACNNDEGPNSNPGPAGYCRAFKDLDTKRDTLRLSSEFCGTDGKVNEGSWKGQYCGYDATSTSKDKVLDGVCDDIRGPNEDKYNDGYCQWPDEDAKGTIMAQVPAALCGTTKMNEGTWKGEACFADTVVAVCTGGRKANTTKKSTDPFSVRCEFKNNPVLICEKDNLTACDKDGCEDLGAGYAWDETASLCKESKTVKPSKRFAKK